jgi:hypothetical protein
MPWLLLLMERIFGELAVDTTAPQSMLGQE